MKKIIVFLVIAVIFIIYLITLDRKVYYLAIGDELSISSKEGYSKKIETYLRSKDKLEIFIDDFSTSNYRITDVINDINNNVKINHNNKDISKKNALIKADLITASIGMNDITSRINIKNINLSDNYDFLYEDVDEIINDLDQMLELLRKYCKEDIILVGLYYPFKVQNKELVNIFLYANNKFKVECEKYNINYIDIYNLFLENSDYLSSENNLYPSGDGYEAIYNQVVVTINNTLLKNSWFWIEKLL